MRERERKPEKAFDSLFPTQALPRQVLRIPLARSQLFAGTSSTPTRKIWSLYRFVYFGKRSSENTSFHKV